MTKPKLKQFSVLVTDAISRYVTVEATCETSAEALAYNDSNWLQSSDYVVDDRSTSGAEEL